MITNSIFIIDGLKSGGAEQQFLFYLRSNFAVTHSHVFYLKAGSLVSQLCSLGYSVYPFYSFSAIRLLFSLIFYSKRSTVVTSWMYKSSIIACICQLLSIHRLKLRIFIRHSDVSFHINTGFLTFISQRLLSVFLIFCKAEVVFCAKSSLVAHAPLFDPFGLKRHEFSVIPNSIDINLFSYSFSKRLSLRQSLGIPYDSFVIGNFSRFHPIKNHSLLLSSFHSFFSKVSSDNVFLLLSGNKIHSSNKVLVELIPDDLLNNVLLLGQQEQSSLADLYSAIDIYFLSSWSEAFPNSLLEALSCSSVTLSVNAGDSFFLQPDSHYRLQNYDPAIASDMLIRANSDFHKPQLWQSLRNDARNRAKNIQAIYSTI